ncbi:glycosyltransferase [Microbacterium protaetiae]|uniref:4,4'-diaponeurosporenoate glycosyltransferase n=1 Tax=Microbacterium protaetiae TaxID=2509458 RepID=A0A4P6EPQ9_9MICO|nr:glycosyltransferase [Microbacterium protaetiae]QAY59958.1 glycosyltransferase [Microbacterium protaetiae]
MTRSTNVPAYPADGSVQFRPAPARVTPALPPDAHGAVIIPAHDESAVIARTLTALAPLTSLPGIEIIVVCNGCSDDTADIARRFAGVQVAETGIGSKTAAMNLGDELATAWPRLYLDADIEIEPQTVLAVFDALAEPGVLAARARYVYDAIGASIPVRSYYRARSRIPAPPKRQWGAGGYATNEEGHRRFGRFDDVTADDSWFDEQFDDETKRVVAAPPMRVRTPRNLAGLLAVLTRQRRGYLELGISSEASSRGRALLSSIRGVRSAMDVGWYTLLTVASRRRADGILRQGERDWERDASSRTGTGDTR